MSRMNAPARPARQAIPRRKQSVLVPSALGLLVFTSVLALMLAQTNVPRLRSLLVNGRWVPLMILAAWPVGTWVLSSRWSGPSIRRFRGFDYWMLGWMGMAMVSSVYSIAPSTTVLVSGTLFLMYGAVFWGTWLYVDRFGERRLTDLLLIAGSLIYAASWAAYFTGAFAPLLEGRFQGILGNPNALGMVTAFLFPLALAKALREKGWYPSLLVGVMVVTLLFTGNRSGLGAAIVGCLYLLWKAEQISKTQIALVLAGATVIGIYFLQGTLENIILRPGQLPSMSGRIAIWDLYTDYIQNRPLLGHGWGTEDLLHNYYGTPLWRLDIRGIYAASSYIGIASQVGVIMSVALFGPLIWIAGRVALRPAGGNLGIHTFNAVLIIGLAVALTESWMSSVGNAQAMPFWIAVMLLFRRRYVRPRQVREPRRASTHRPRRK